jgi:hypothetical protein
MLAQQAFHLSLKTAITITLRHPLRAGVSNRSEPQLGCLAGSMAATT